MAVGGGWVARAAWLAGQAESLLLANQKAPIQQILTMYDTLALELKSIKARLLDATKQLSNVAPGGEIADKK